MRRPPTHTRGSSAGSTRVVPGLVVAVLGLGLTGCSGGDEEAVPVDPAVASTDVDASASAGAEVEPAEPAPPLAVGEERYLSPCRLVDLEDVQEVFGRLGADGYLAQTVLTASLEGEELEEALSFGRVRTSCRYVYGDRDSTTLRATVEQFPRERRAQAEWEKIRSYGAGERSRRLVARGAPSYLVELTRDTEEESGGVPVEDAPGLLFVAAQREFVLVAGHTVVRLSYGPNADAFRLDPFSEREYAAQVPEMRDLAARVTERLESGLDDQAPATAVLDGSETLGGTTRLLEPCALLSDDVFEAATGWEAGPEAEVTSYRMDTRKRYRRYAEERPLVASSSASCQRSAVREDPRGGTTRRSVELTVQPTDDPLRSFEVLEAYLGNLYFDGPTEDTFRISQFVGLRIMRELEGTAADRAFVLDTKEIPQASELSRSTTAYATIGPYVVILDADRGSSLGRDPKVLKDRQYAAALDLVASAVPAPTTTSGEE